MKNLSKQVVILDNLSSPYIHQAIIILKDHAKGYNEKIITEAEKIVSSYFNREPILYKNSDLSKKIFLLKCTVIILSISLIASICLGIYS